MSQLKEKERFSIKVKKIYWAFLKLLPRNIKDVGKKILNIYIPPIKKTVKYLIHKFPFIFFPINYIRVLLILKRRRNEIKGIIIYPPTVDWSWMKQRPHQLMEGLSNEGYLCFYVNINHKTNTGRRTFKKLNNNLYLVGNLHVLYQIQKPILLISWTEHIDILNRFKNPRIIYDYLDDLSVSAEEINQDKYNHHQYLLEKSDIVMVTATKLEEDALKYRKEVIMVPNAGNYADFHLTKKPNLPKDLSQAVAKGNKVIGYYGALAKWFDYNLIKETAKKRPEYEFVLIGPDYDNSIHSQHLDEIDNIHWLGIKQYEELPCYLYYFDTTIIPFKVNKITRATSPVKIFEYMAGNKPIVSTPLDECKKYQSVLIAKDSDEFAIKIDESLKLIDNKDFIKTVQREAKENTWDERIQVIQKALRNLNE